MPSAQEHERGSTLAASSDPFAEKHPCHINPPITIPIKHHCLPSKHRPFWKVFIHAQSQPLRAFWGFTPVLCLSPPKPKKGAKGPAVMQG